MERYLLFTYVDYYPAGARGDYEASFSTLEELHEYMNKEGVWIENYDVLDRIEGEWVE